MADFNKFLPILLQNEGGWVDNPRDPGGATNKGVTIGTLREYGPRLLGIPANIENLRALTDEQAGRIYKSQYWDSIYGDDIELQDLANIVCDFSVNAGFHATRLFIVVLNNAGADHNPNGRLTPKILDSLNNHEVPEIYMHYKAGRIAYYRNLVQEHPGLRIFLRGWLNRVNAFPDL
jgi:lysozyme family protein